MCSPSFSNVKSASWAIYSAFLAVPYGGRISLACRIEEAPRSPRSVDSQATLARSALVTHSRHGEYAQRLPDASSKLRGERPLDELNGGLSRAFWQAPAIAEALASVANGAAPRADRLPSGSRWEEGRYCCSAIISCSTSRASSCMHWYHGHGPCEGPGSDSREKAPRTVRACMGPSWHAAWNGILHKQRTCALHHGGNSRG